MKKYINAPGLLFTKQSKYDNRNTERFLNADLNYKITVSISKKFTVLESKKMFLEKTDFKENAVVIWKVRTREHLFVSYDCKVI